MCGLAHRRRRSNQVRIDRGERRGRNRSAISSSARTSGRSAYCRAGKTRALANTDIMPTADFIRDRNVDFEAQSAPQDLAQGLRRDQRRDTIDASGNRASPAGRHCLQQHVPPWIRLAEGTCPGQRGGPTARHRAQWRRGRQRISIGLRSWPRGSDRRRGCHAGPRALRRAPAASQSLAAIHRTADASSSPPIRMPRMASLCRLRRDIANRRRRSCRRRAVWR